MLEVRITQTEGELEKVFDIRRRVFVSEQGISPELDKDGKDDKAEHVLATLDNQEIGCGRIRYIDSKAKLERIAVLKQFRGKGYGEHILFFMIGCSKEKGASEIYLDAQYPAKGFYQKYGFKLRGEPFEEAGIQHVEMVMEV